MSDYDPDYRKKKQEEVRSKKDQRLDDLRQLLSTAYGRRYMRGLVEFHGVFQAIPGTNNVEIYKAMGKREAGLRIYSEIAEADPELAQKMFVEYLRKE
tara:strand:+ start:37 stop:330 length:294 start_codon:yes stop_codon:yes gene_type:complete